MARLRRFITASIFFGLLGLSIGATVHVARQGLPEPFDMGKVDLRQWLVERNLRSQSRAMRQRIVAQFERDFAAGRDWRAEVAELSPEDQEKFRRNFGNLTRVWLRGMAEGYLRAAEEQRGAYLDQQLKRLRAWQPLDLPAEQQAASGRRRMNAKQLTERLPEIFAEGERREWGRELAQAQMFLQALQMHGINRAFDPARE